MRIIRIMASVGLVGILATALDVQRSQAQELPQPLLGACCACKAKIQFTNAQDVLQFTARINPNPGAIIDPITTGMTLTLENADGTIFSTSIGPGEFSENSAGKRYIYADNGAKKTGGIRVVTLKRKDDGVGDGYLLYVRAYGDLATATLAEMTTTVSIGSSLFFDIGDWTERKKGWRRKFVVP